MGNSLAIDVPHHIYEDYIDHLQLNNTSHVDIGTVMMTLRANVLKEVIVRQQISAIIKGDTIEFAANSFKTREGASVEEMLKKLPGIQVDKDFPSVGLPLPKLKYLPGLKEVPLVFLTLAL